MNIIIISIRRTGITLTHQCYFWIKCYLVEPLRDAKRMKKQCIGRLYTIRSAHFFVTGGSLANLDFL